MTVTVFVDRAPADGLLDEALVLPMVFKVKVRVNKQGVTVEAGLRSNYLVK